MFWSAGIFTPKCCHMVQRLRPVMEVLPEIFSGISLVEWVICPPQLPNNKDILLEGTKIFHQPAWKMQFVLFLITIKFVPSNSDVPRTPAQRGSSLPGTNSSAPLYTMRRNFSNFRSANYHSLRGGRKQPAKPSGVFSRDVILLTGPEDEDLPRQGNTVFLQENGHVVMAFPFMKEWSGIGVQLKIKEAYQDTIPPLVDFELLQSVHTKLLKPTLAQGLYLTGAMIRLIFQPVYVRPTQQILKPPKTRKKYEDFDGQDYVDHNVPGATGENVSSASQSAPTGATGENVSVHQPDTVM